MAWSTVHGGREPGRLVERGSPRYALVHRERRARCLLSILTNRGLVVGEELVQVLGVEAKAAVPTV
jgi:hypothetical protein